MRLILLLGFVSFASCQKTVLFPAPNGLSVLEAVPLPTVKATNVTKWESGSYPLWCWDMASSLRLGQTVASCAPSSIEVYDVTYSDCRQNPWTLCRCTDAQLTLEELIKSFGQTPPGIRSYVRHVFALDGTQEDGTIKKGGGSTDDMFAIWGPAGQTVFLHENFHSVDQEFHNNLHFKQAANLNGCIPDAASKASLAELFAQESVVYTYDQVASLAERGYDGSCMKRQLGVIGDYLNTQPASGECFKRRPNSPRITRSLEGRRSLEIGEPWVNPMVVEFFD